MEQNIFKDIYFKRSQLALNALKKNGFEALYADSAKEAHDKVMSIVPKEAKVGVGGSITLKELGLVEALRERGNIIFIKSNKKTMEEQIEIRKKALTIDTYLSSSNAITLQGQLLNIDSTGNRVAAMIFGPKKVIIIAGANKLVDTLEEAFARIRNIASPLNARRLNLNTPCALTGKCTNCDSPDRICNVTVILERRPKRSDITIILVGEHLGY